MLNDEISKVRAECQMALGGMPNRRNAERAECRILTVVTKQTKSCISLLLSLCGASMYSQYYKIRLDILCKSRFSRKFDSRPYCSLIMTKEHSQPKITLLYLDAKYAYKK